MKMIRRGNADITDTHKNKERETKNIVTTWIEWKLLNGFYVILCTKWWKEMSKMMFGNKSSSSSTECSLLQLEMNKKEKPIRLNKTITTVATNLKKPLMYNKSIKKNSCLYKIHLVNVRIYVWLPMKVEKKRMKTLWQHRNSFVFTCEIGAIFSFFSFFFLLLLLLCSSSPLLLLDYNVEFIRTH